MITYEFAFLIGGALLLIFLAIGFIMKIGTRKIIAGCLFIAYLTVVASITLFPILYDNEVEYWGDVTWYNFIPFRTITNMFSYGFNTTAFIQLAGNICMSIPYGIFIMMFVDNKKWWKLLLFALLFTVSIEFLQFLIGIILGNMYRTVDIDDAILNVLGCYIGYIIYKLLPKSIKNFLIKKQA